MSRLIMCCCMLVCLPITASILGAPPDNLTTSKSAQAGRSVSDFLTPDGRFDLDAMRAVGYQGPLDLKGVDVRVDPRSGAPMVSVDSPESPADHPDDIYWDNGISPWLAGVDGTVKAAMVYNGNLVVGGSFQAAGCVIGNCIASWNGSTWSPLGSGMNNWETDFACVYALTVYNGNLIAGGKFLTAGGAMAICVASWDGSSWSPLGSGIVGGGVFALTVHDGKLIAGGRFYEAGGSLAYRIASWDGSTWSPLGSGMDGDVSALTVYNGNLIAGGSFSTAGGTSASHIASWDGSTWSPLGLGMDGDVSALTEYNGNLIAGGSFSTAGGTSANGIASWNGTAWSPLGSGMRAQALTSYFGYLIAGGDSVARWDGSNWAPWGSGIIGSVYALAEYHGTPIAGGNFTTPSGTSAYYIASMTVLDAWEPLGSGMSSTVNALTVYNGNLIMGGPFTTAGGTSANYIASWDGFAWSPLGSGTYGPVASLTVYNGNLIAGGVFTTGDGTSLNYVASWDGSTWSLLGSGMDGPVVSLTVYNGHLIAGGGFTTAGGTSANRIASWDGSSWSPLGSGMGGFEGYTYVNALTVYKGNLIAGGEFHIAGGDSANNIACWDGSRWSALREGIGPSEHKGCEAIVSALTVYDNKLIVGWTILCVVREGVETGFISCWDGSNWSVLGAGFMAETGAAMSAAADISSVTTYENRLIVGGWFDGGAGVTAASIVSWDGSAWSPLGSGIRGNYPLVKALTVYNGDLIAGGPFTAAGGKVSAGLAAWTKHCCTGLAGNIDGDADDAVDIGDLSAMADYLFLSGAIAVCPGENDVDRTGAVDISDLTMIIDYMFYDGILPNCL